MPKNQIGQGQGLGLARPAQTTFQQRGTQRKPKRSPMDDRGPRGAGEGGPQGRSRAGLGINVEAWIAAAVSGMSKK